MDEQESQAGEPKPRGQGIGRSLDRQRRRAEELLAAQKARLEKAESDLTAQIDSLIEAVAAEIPSTTDVAGIEQSEQAEALREHADELHRAQLELAERERRLAEEQRVAAEQLRSQQELLDRGNSELERRQESVKRELEELNLRQSEIDAAAARVRQTEIILNSTNGDQAQQIEQLANREARAAELEKRLAYEQDQLEMLREQTKTQRRRIAQELKAERASQQRELTRLRHDVEIYQAGQRQSLDQAAKQLQHERAELENELAAKRDEVRRQRIALDEKEAELATAQRQLDARAQQLAQERTDEADRLRQEIDGLQGELIADQDAAGKAAGELAALQKAHEELHRENDTLRRSDETLEQAHNLLLQNHAALEKTLTALQQSHDKLLDTHQRQTQVHEELSQSHETLIAAKLKSDEALAQSTAALNERVSALAESNAALVGKTAALAALDQSHQELQGQFDRQTQAYGELRQAHEELVEAKRNTDQALAQSQAMLSERTAALAENNAALAGKSTALAALEQSHQELCGELDRQSQSYSELRQSHNELTQTHDKLQQSHGELHVSHDELTQAHFALTQSYDEVLQAKRQIDGALAERASATVNDAGELQELRAEREAVIARLAEAESKLAKADTHQTDELQRRFELAVEDVRSLKRRNSELEEEVLALKSAGPRTPAATTTSDRPNWETMKRNMIASLESDTDSTEGRDEERVTIENTIQITDDVVAQKDREIAEMKTLLSQQCSNIDSIAVGATAVAAAVIDKDELILQERAKLAELQDQWKSKLRQAEIDISVERAKITRDRAEIEDKLAAYEKERSKQAADGGSPDEANGGAKKPTRGRWLARLGLKDGD